MLSADGLLELAHPLAHGAANLWQPLGTEDEGLFTGVSAGAIASIAVRVASELDEGNVVFIVPDDGWKYLSSGVYTKPLDELDLDSASFW